MTFRSINRLALIAALAFGWVVLGGAARAQAPSAGALAAAKELVALKGGGSMKARKTSSCRPTRIS